MADIATTKGKTEHFDEQQGVHESYPKHGDSLTAKHGSPSPMHAPGVDRFIKKQGHPMHMSSVK